MRKIYLLFIFLPIFIFSQGNSDLDKSLSEIFYNINLRSTKYSDILSSKTYFFKRNFNAIISEKPTYVDYVNRPEGPKFPFFGKQYVSNTVYNRLIQSPIANGRTIVNIYETERKTFSIAQEIHFYNADDLFTEYAKMVQLLGSYFEVEEYGRFISPKQKEDENGEYLDRQMKLVYKHSPKDSEFKLTITYQDSLVYRD